MDVDSEESTSCAPEPIRRVNMARKRQAVGALQDTSSTSNFAALLLHNSLLLKNLLFLKGKSNQYLRQPKQFLNTMTQDGRGEGLL
jgi:hypothetical protein